MPSEALAKEGCRMRYEAENLFALQRCTATSIATINSNPE